MAWESLSFESARKLCLPDDAAEAPPPPPRILLFQLIQGIGDLTTSFTRSHGDCTRGLVCFTMPEKDKLKIKLNAKKYPAGIVKGSALKYDAYHATTGYGKGSKQVTTESGEEHLSAKIGQPWSVYDLEDLRVQLEQFAEQRNWAQFHTPRNLALALCGEVGELCELFQFKSEDLCLSGLLGWRNEERDKLSQELSDVCIYLLRLSDVCGVNLSAVMLNKYGVRSSSDGQPGQSTYCKGYPWLGGCLLLGLAAAVVLAGSKRC